MEPEILIVDDDSAIRETLRLILEDEGYRVVEARDGRIALRILRAAPYPLVVLLDQCMPNLDGAGVLHEANADSAIAGHHAFILLTASAAALSDAKRDFDPLLDGIVAKPFDLDALLETIAQALARIRFSTALPPMDAANPYQAGGLC